MTLADIRYALHSAGVWLFGRRAVRQQRPVRRIGPLAFGVACLTALFAGATPAATAAAVTGTLILIAAMVI